MGSNYYAFDERITETTDFNEGLHIGKNSCGWVFHFESHYKPKLKTVQDYREFLKEKVIYDEYDREISYEEFWSIVEDSKKLFNGSPPYVLIDPNYPNDYTRDSWVDEGFAFTESEFS